MNWKSFFKPQGLNLWLVGVSFGWSVLWVFVSLLVAFLVLRADADAAGTTQIGLMLSAFLGSLLSGWLIGWLAADGRGPTYGLISGLVSAILFGIALVPIGGVLGLLVAVVSLAGGLNGGLLSLRRPPRR
jgi:hypothetical protein